MLKTNSNLHEDVLEELALRSSACAAFTASSKNQKSMSA